MFGSFIEKVKGGSELFIPTLSEQSLDSLKFHAKKNKIGFEETVAGYSRMAKKQVRSKNPIAPNQADLVNWIIYDRWTVAAATTTPSQFKFFTQPIGTNSKTKTDTNMEQVQRLPDPQWANVIGVGFYLASTMGKVDIDALLNGYYHEFWVSQKVYAEGPIQCFPGASGLAASFATTAALTGPGAGVLTNGVARTDNFFDARLPAGLQLPGMVTDGLIGITILQGQSFHVDMNSPAGTFSTAAGPAVGVNVMCYLYSILSRGVQ